MVCVLLLVYGFRFCIAQFASLVSSLSVGLLLAYCLHPKAKLSANVFPAQVSDECTFLFGNDEF